jgi:hypothetical protein
MVRVAIITPGWVVLFGCATLLPLNPANVRMWIAAVQFSFTRIAQLVKFELLLFFQVAASGSILAIRLTALCQLAILAFVQAVHLVIEIGFKLSARVWCF